jgi:cation diffusion facilitator CzcD-associated flavoprotein CzcO
MSIKAQPVPKSVLVIGAGPTGLVGLRNLIERGKYEHVELWERRDDIGGVWYDVFSQAETTHN